MKTSNLDFGSFVLIGPDGVKLDLGRGGFVPPELIEPEDDIEEGRLILPDLLGELIFGAQRPRNRSVRRIDRAERFFRNIEQRGPMKFREQPKLLFSDSLGVYNSQTHEVSVSPIESFYTEPEFYRVKAHETMHWTAPFVDRMEADAIANEIRETVDSYGDRPIPKHIDDGLRKRYLALRAREELVAELGAKRVMKHLDLDTPENQKFTADYLLRYSMELNQNSDLPAHVHQHYAEQQSQKALDFLISLQEAA